VDKDAEFANKLGLAFDVPENVFKALKESSGVDLENVCGKTASRKLVLPATILVGQNGKVLHTFVDNDYTKRLEPSEIVDWLKNYSKVESS